MELALLTDAFIVISIYDSSEKRATTFQSHEIEPDYSEVTVQAHERFRPKDVSNPGWFPSPPSAFELFLAWLKLAQALCL